MRSRYAKIIGGALAAFLLATGIIMGTMYDYFSDAQRQQLHSETEMVSLATALNGAAYLAELPHENYRVTWIGADGTVLFDNEADTSEMENHLQREEVHTAIMRGYGESQRYSGTMMTRMLYSAQKLADGSVVRLSMPQHTVLSIIYNMALPIGLILLVVIIVSATVAARETKKANQEESEAMRREFTANVSHELKTPLHSILGYTELLKNGMVMEQDTDYFIEKIHAVTQRMIRLVEDIIVLSRLDEGKENTTRAQVNLYQLAEGAMTNLADLAEKHDVTMELIGQQVTMDGIAHLLNSMIFNICENAIKYNQPGGSVLIEVSEFSGHPQISVRDTGIGIPKKDRSRIFERFYRVDKSHSKEIGGTGLGLSIVKHAARLHGAKIEVDSIVGEGTVVTIRF